MEIKFELSNRKVTIFYPETHQKCIYVYTHQVKHVYPFKTSNVVFVYIENNDYESDFTPYPHHAVFKGGRDFSGKADEYLDLLLKIAHKAESDSGYPVERRILAGYSLGGLFSLYATRKTDIFSEICCASASFWYPDFTDYVKRHDFFFCRGYFSIGEKESKTKNPYLAKAYQQMMTVKKILEERNHEIYFDLNEGGHFTDPVKRVDKGIWRLLNNTCMHFDDENEKRITKIKSEK